MNYDLEIAKLTMPVSARDHIQGPTDAPLTLVEYGDYECPACGQAYPLVKAIQRNVGDAMRLVFRNFPLVNAHPFAEHAAEAAEAAATRNLFWEMHDTLFENQDSLEDPQLAGYAAELGLNGRELIREVREERYARRIREDFLSGVRSGVNGTPTFFINGIRYDGNYDLESMLEALNEAAG